ncbi:drug/metabolite exporter YedA [Undibacterium sp. Jales W-56]|uniref:drug/metabolite exporter YedA n=1 Tax=Undibacterium sp. Jales W-56 TaxID=2897325 RepID=UPI0021CF4714|nr:drug/metabolite exporter YedA [Undibacterium sp. Jales W-56]MCU6434043.1 drug/metabolite exporter YedA [Undibacterium sp. Jales W-56]
MSRLPRPVLIALLTVYIVWGSTYFAIHVALSSFPPFLLMGTRFLMAGGLLFAWQKSRGAVNPSWREWRDAGVVGVLMLGGGMGLTAVAQQSISSGLTAVFIACSPMILSFCVGLFGDWPNRREWIGIVAGFAGAVLLSLGGEFSARPIGVISLLGAILCWDIGSVLSQRKLKMAPGAMGFASEMLLGGVFLTAIGFFAGEKFITPITVNAMLAWSYLVVAGSLLAFTAYMYLLSAVPPALAGSYAYVNPVIAVALGVMLGGEQIAAREMLAMTIILASVFMLTTARNKQKR